MSKHNKIARVSIMLVAQQLFLNVVSIFVIGYMARKLGQDAYGKLVFGYSFVAMFMPLTSLGIGSFSTREMTEQEHDRVSILGRILATRIVLTMFVTLIMGCILVVMKYSADVIIVVFLAFLSTVVGMISTVLYSFLQSTNRIAYTAQNMFRTGLIVTGLTVLSLWLNMGLIGLSVAYFIGNIIGFLFLVRFIYSSTPVIVLNWNVPYIKSLFYRGRNYFFPDLANIVANKIGIVFLTKLASAHVVGSYGAAINLVEKLNIIPDSLSTTSFPEMIKSNAISRSDASDLFSKLILHMIICGLPIAIGVSLLSKEIVSLIYGETYRDSALILAVLGWWFFANSLHLLQNMAINVVHREKLAAIRAYISAILYIALGLLMIKHYAGVGVALSLFIVSIINVSINSVILRNTFSIKPLKRKIVSVIIINMMLVGYLFVSQDLNVILKIVLSVPLYFLLIEVFGVVKIASLIKQLRP